MSHEKRSYRMQLRAESEAQTRRRITESAVELHGTLGPSRSSISAIAEQAGVRRSTVYRHFPDEAALFAACTAHWQAANPLPDLTSWSAIDDVNDRLRTALRELYAHYRHTESMMTNIHRDQSSMPIVKKMMADYRTYLADARRTLMAGRKLAPFQRRLVRAAIAHALSFPAWRSLAVEEQLKDSECADLMCWLVAGAA